jgi:hypothetical protein
MVLSPIRKIVKQQTMDKAIAPTHLLSQNIASSFIKKAHAMSGKHTSSLEEAEDRVSPGRQSPTHDAYQQSTIQAQDPTVSQSPFLMHINSPLYKPRTQPYLNPHSCVSCHPIFSSIGVRETGAQSFESDPLLVIE